MGNVNISPNIKKESARIDFKGNQIDPKTKQVVVPVEVPFVPDQADVQAVLPKPETPKEENPLAEMIKKQVQEAVKKQIASIDISGMVAEALKDAFK